MRPGRLILGTTGLSDGIGEDDIGADALALYKRDREAAAPQTMKGSNSTAPHHLLAINDDIDLLGTTRDFRTFSKAMG